MTNHAISCGRIKPVLVGRCLLAVPGVFHAGRYLQPPSPFLAAQPNRNRISLTYSGRRKSEVVSLCQMGSDPSMGRRKITQRASSPAISIHSSAKDRSCRGTGLPARAYQEAALPRSPSSRCNQAWIQAPAGSGRSWQASCAWSHRPARASHRTCNSAGNPRGGLLSSMADLARLSASMRPKRFANA